MSDEHDCPNCGATMTSDPWSGGSCPECDHWDIPIDDDHLCECASCVENRT